MNSFKIGEGVNITWVIPSLAIILIKKASLFLISNFESKTAGQRDI